MHACRYQWLQAAEGFRERLHVPSVLVVDESPAARERWTSLLVQAFPTGSVTASASVRKSRELLATQPFDIAVVDLHLPDGSAIEVVQESMYTSPLTRCIVTSIYDDDAHVMAALAAGALGYLLKDQPDTVLVQQLRLLAEGIPPLAPSVAQRLVRYFAGQTAAEPAASARDPQDGLVRLSEREKQVLCLIAKGMQIAEVAQLLDIASNTVCSHIKSIYRKRNLSSRAEAALEAKRLGLV